MVGSGVDEITAVELALKLEEAIHVPTTPLGAEKVLHGHLPAADRDTALVLLRFDPDHRGERDRRSADVAAAASVLDMPTVALGTRDAVTPGEALLAGAVALQLLTLELYLAVGTNPDLIRREQPLYRQAAEAGPGSPAGRVGIAEVQPACAVVGPMLPRSAVRKAAAGQRPALRALDDRTRRPGQASSSAPAHASAALGEPGARPAAVRSRSRASWAWLSSGAVSGTVTYPITGSLPVMAQRSSARRVWHRSGSYSGSPDTGSCRPGRWSAAGHMMTPHRTPGSGPRSISWATVPRGSSESWIRCSTPGSRTAAGCPTSSTSAARHKITPGSRRSAWR